MQTQDIEHILIDKNVKPTAVRIIVARELAMSQQALSLSNLESKLYPTDKSSIFRALSVFLGHHIVHRIDDGTGQSKYALCAKDCHCGEDIPLAIEDEHTHFHCQRCGHTYCLPDIPIPHIDMPEDFKAFSANMVFKGICPECKHKRDKKL